MTGTSAQRPADPQTPSSGAIPALGIDPAEELVMMQALTEFSEGPPERCAAGLRRLLDQAIDRRVSPVLRQAIAALYLEACAEMYAHMLGLMDPDDFEWHVWSWAVRPARRRFPEPTVNELRLVHT